MIRQYNFLFCFVLVLLSIGQLQAQHFSDWELRPGIAVEHEFDNGIEARVRYRHCFDGNMSHYKESAFDLKVDYKINLNSWLQPSIDYRYKFDGKEGYHDIRYAAEFAPKLGDRLELEYAPKLQQIITSGEDPEFYIRNKIEMTYSLSTLWSVFLFSENYQSIENGVQFDAQKNGLGAECEISTTNAMELKIDIKNNSDHEQIGRLTLSYTHKIQ